MGLDRLSVLPLSLVFSSSVFLPNFQKGRFDDFPLPAAASVDSTVPNSPEDDLEDSINCGNDPGSSGAIDPRDSVSLGCVVLSL